MKKEDGEHMSAQIAALKDEIDRLRTQLSDSLEENSELRINLQTTEELRYVSIEDVSELEREIEKMKIEVEGSRQDQERLKKICAEKVAYIKQLSFDLQDAREIERNRDVVVIDLRKDLEILKRENRCLREKCDERIQEIKGKIEHIEKLKEEIKKLEEEIKNLREHFDNFAEDRDAQIADLKIDLNAKDEEIWRLNEEAKKKDDHIVRLAKTIDDLKGQLNLHKEA